jgi:hypothetical protein
LPIFGLPHQPSTINARPLSEVQDPGVVFRFFATLAGRVKSFGANPIFALEGEQVFFERVNVREQFS